MKQAMHLSLFVLSAYSWVGHAWDVGFSDAKFYIKTKITDGKQAPAMLQFWFCQIGRDDQDKGDCFRLSSCPYDSVKMDAEVAKMKDGDVKEELQLLTTGSYQSRLQSAKYLPEFLKLLKALSPKEECVLATRVDIKGDDQVSVVFAYPKKNEAE